MLTLEQFQATKTPITNLQTITGYDWHTNQPALTYHNNLYIIKDQGGYILEIENHEYTSTFKNLHTLETKLYEWAKNEGYFDK